MKLAPTVLWSRAVDAPPPPPTDPPAYIYAPTDIAPRSDRERKLCERASTVDWLYLSALVLADVATIYVDGQVFKYQNESQLRTIGPALVGLTWGATLGAIYPALPKCDPTWISYAPPEGEVRSSLPYALSMALLAGATAPVIMGIETGPLKDNWTTTERVTRVLVSGATGFIGALLPYWTVISPRTWRAGQELAKIRAWGDSNGAFLGYGFQF
ncbi:hypothetical protein [Pendulispora albinea]|uniref:Uncharacterized protein n=1 Tax=Pendulispora albinea TaxID=2741071 RepID=A0ABZ2LUJ3_9BACT